MSTGEIRQHIRNACIAGLLSVVAGVIVSLAGVWGIGPWGLVSAALTLGLTYGIARYSRACAVTMLACYILGRVDLWLTQGHFGALGLFVALLFVYVYVQGIRATFAYHRVRRIRAA